MDANNFVNKLKASGSSNDWTNLQVVYDEYKNIATKLSAKDRGSFSLNVLCILCRNIDKIPSWRDRVDCKLLLTLSIDCVRETRTAERPDRVKTLACIYHIHKYVVKQCLTVPPELVLKLSFMPFENDVKHMLHEYAKTYWNIIADRILYIERLKTKHMQIIKLLPKLIEDMFKVIHIYDTVPFCINIITFVVKKLHFLYSDCYSKEVNEVFGKIFESLTKKNDLKAFKTIKSEEALDLYAKFSDCFYVIVENSLKCGFKDTVLSEVVRSCMMILGSHSELFHCLQTFYLNSFCSILCCKTNPIFLETILNALLVACETTERLGYAKAMKVTYPFINQLLRIYIEYMANNSENFNWKENFTDTHQEMCLKLIYVLMQRLKTTTQMLKCDGCNVKSGLHDALRLSFLDKHFITISLNQGITLHRILPMYYKVIQMQHKVLVELQALGCANYEKCYKKLQTDVHNIAISLNKAQYYEHSIKLFNIYLQNEITHFKTETDLKNISRALYNKSICELDDKQFENALKNAFLSLLFGLPESIQLDKYMSLVMDIKAKSLKHEINEDDDKNDLQMISILDASKDIVNNNVYGNLKPFLKHLKYTELLIHELVMYVKLWPSITPVAGVWKSLYSLYEGDKPDWMAGEPKETISQALYQAILTTVTSVRTIHCDTYREIVTALVKDFENDPPKDPEIYMVYASLLVIKSEQNLAEASQKYGWKIDPTVDPDLINMNRTLPIEYEALLPALKSVDIWSQLVKDLDKVYKSPLLAASTKLSSLAAQELLHCSQLVAGLEMSYVCCQIAVKIQDEQLLLQNLSNILSHCTGEVPVISTLVAGHWPRCWDGPLLGIKVEFVCDVALYYNKCGSPGVAARLLQFAQCKILDSVTNDPQVNLDLAIGRLLHTQYELCPGGLSTLTQINALQKHYLTISNQDPRWSYRRLLSLLISRRLVTSSLLGGARLASLGAWRRAGAAAGGAGNVAGAAAAARGGGAVVNVCDTVAARVRLSNQLKRVVPFQPSRNLSNLDNTPQKLIPFTPNNNIECMLDNMTFKTPISPLSLPVTITPFNLPEHIKHRNCKCYACNTPYSPVLATMLTGLEAALYFREKQYDAAKSYFEGCFHLYQLFTCPKIEDDDKDNNFIARMVRDIIQKELHKNQIQTLIEAVYFKVSLNKHQDADELVVRIHEIMNKVDTDKYIQTEVMNAMIVSALTRNKDSKIQTDVTDIEVEMENLKLDQNVTPNKDEPKTPDTKLTKPPNNEVKIVKDEEVPKMKRKVIKLNLDEEEPETTKQTRSRSTFKLPIPVTSKPILEAIPSTPKPKILITQPSLDRPKKKEVDSLTKSKELDSQTQKKELKTTTKTLRQKVVNDESTPMKSDIERSKQSSASSSKRSLRRATSPGKLEKLPSSRIKRPLRKTQVQFSLDD